MTDNLSELDEIFNDDYFDVKVAKQAILDWHKQEIVKARIDELKKHSEWIHWFGDKPCITIPLDEYNDRIAELKQELR